MHALYQRELMWFNSRYTTFQPSLISWTWVVTGRMRSHVQVVKMNFLQEVAVLSLRKAKELRNLLRKWCVNLQCRASWGSSAIWSVCLLGAFLRWFTSPTSRGLSGVDCKCKLVWSIFLYFCTYISVFLPQAAEDCVDPNISWWSNVVMICIAQRQPVLLISLWWTCGLVFAINLMLILIF